MDRIAHPNSELVGVDASDETFAIEMMQLGQQGRVEEEGLDTNVCLLS